MKRALGRSLILAMALLGGVAWWSGREDPSPEDLTVVAGSASPEYQASVDVQPLGVEVLHEQRIASVDSAADSPAGSPAHSSDRLRGPAGALPIRQEMAMLSQAFRDGSVTIEDTVELARLLLKACPQEDFRLNDEGWRVYGLPLGEEGLQAELHTRTRPASGQRELQFSVHSKEGYHDSIDSSFTAGARLELSMQLDGAGALSQCRALSVTELVPSNDFYSAHHGLGALAVGGLLQAGNQTCSWRPVTMVVEQTEGLYSMRQTMVTPHTLPFLSVSYSPGFLAYDVESLFAP